MSFRYFAFAVVMSLGVLVAPPVLAGLNDGLVAYYPFNGNANDESGNGYHGTVVGATLTDDRFGNLNSAYSFDGVDDYIKILSGPNLQGFSQTTLAAWINSKPNIGKGESRIIEIGKNWPNSTALVLDVPGMRQGSFRAWFHADGQRKGEIGSGWDGVNYHDGQWHLVVFTYDGSTTRLYVDGILKEQGSGTGVIDSPPVALIGQLNFSSPSNGSVFGGIIDDVRVYNRALTESEIQALYEEKNVCETEGECGTEGEYTQAELDAAYQQGFTDGVATCSESGACQPATLSSDLKMHVPALHYTPPLVDTPIVLWADFELSDINKLLFQVTNYGVKEE
jgi:hypothetical protein